MPVVIIDSRSKYPVTEDGSTRIVTEEYVKQLIESNEKRNLRLARRKANKIRKKADTRNKNKVFYDEINNLKKQISGLTRKLSIKEAVHKKCSKYPESPQYTKGMGSDFYTTREWRDIRWKVISTSDGKCSACGRSRKDGVILHVDHIKPRSKYPELELTIDNLQVMCEDCNMGKGAKPQTF